MAKKKKGNETKGKKKKKRNDSLLHLGAFALAALTAASCSSMYPIAGAGLGAGIGSLGGTGLAAVGGATGATLGELVEANSATSEAEEFNREMVERLIGMSSEESRAHAVALATEQSVGVLDGIQSFFVGLLKWVAALALIYVVARALLSKRQEDRFATKLKEAVEKIK